MTFNDWISEIKSSFRSIDTNGDGRLSIKEFKEAANKMGQNVTTKQVKEMFKLVDDNGMYGLVTVVHRDMVTGFTFPRG